MEKTFAVQGKVTGMTPVQPSQRIVVVDILRGFALLGVLIANMHPFSGYFAPFQDMGSANRTAFFLIKFLTQAKFYTLFSFLFGWGMSIQMKRAIARGGRFASLYARRLLVLLVIGLAHAILIWDGDILVSYALLGFPLLIFRKLPPRALLVAVVICLLIPILISTPGPGESFRAAYEGWIDPWRAPIQAAYRSDIYRTGSYQELVIHRLRELRVGLARSLYWAPHVLGMFLLGLYAGKRRLFHDISNHLPFFRRAMWAGLLLGVPLNLLWVQATFQPDLVPTQYYELTTRGVRILGGPILSMFYVCAIVLLSRREAWRRALSPLAGVGRMALTNYLLQSVICTMIFYGYGLGLFGRFGPAATLVLTLVIYRVQIGLSRRWLRRYRFGPMEWIWRSLTYGRPQPFLTERRLKVKEVLRK